MPQGYSMPGIHRRRDERIRRLRGCSPRRAPGPGPARAQPCWSAAPTVTTAIPCSTTPCRTAPQEEEEHWRGRDPLKLFRETVIPQGEITAAELDAIDAETATLMEEAVKYADESPLPEPHELYEDVYVDYPLDMMRRGANMPA